MQNTTEFSFLQSGPDERLSASLAGDIETQGYTILPNVLPQHVSSAFEEYMARLSSSSYHEGGIGRGLDEATNPFVRRNHIHWLEESQTDLAPWFQWIKQLQLYLNRHLFMGLFSFESHIAWYEPGGFYKRHVDAFRGESNRVLSLVTYLNRGWLPDQGGEFVLYPPGAAEQVIKVLPSYGTVVMFLSEEFPHEVLTSDRSRIAVAGWFRRNGSIGDQIDPPR